MSRHFGLVFLLGILATWVSPAQDAKLVFPHFVDGGEGPGITRTRIILRNSSGEAIAGRVLFWDQEGSPAGVSIGGEDRPEAPFSLGPWASEEIITNGTGPLRAGAVEVFVDSGPDFALSGSEVFELFGLPVSVSGTLPSATFRNHVSVSSEEGTGIAVFNPSSLSTAELDLVLLDQHGSILASRTITVSPRHQLAAFITEDSLLGEFLGDTSANLKGTLGIHVSDGPQVCVLGLLQKASSGAVSSIETVIWEVPPGEGSAEFLEVELLDEYPHDEGSFTQGLVWADSLLYESTGLYGFSTLRMNDLETGQAILRVDLEPQFFGEGLALVDDRLIQLTWKENRAFVYDSGTLGELGKLDYRGEGWGLTFDGTWLIMSDGSHMLSFRDPRTLAIWQRVPVKLDGQPVSRLNELEWVDGQIYANVWQTTEIVGIDPETGRVTALIDASSLPYQPRNPADDSLNGIAFVPERGTFLLTGKRWPAVYEVRFVPVSAYPSRTSD